MGADCSALLSLKCCRQGDLLRLLFLPVKPMLGDITVSGKTPLEVAKKAEDLGMKGIIKYGSFVHVDTRTTKYFSNDGGSSCTTFY